MEKFKERILSLEKNVVDLNTRVGSIQGTTISVHPSHYSVYDKEQGETPLDEFDTFRFIKFNADNMHMRNSESGPKYSLDKNMYKLINPSKDLLPYIKNGLNWAGKERKQIDKHTNTKLVHYKDS